MDIKALLEIIEEELDATGASLKQTGPALASLMALAATMPQDRLSREKAAQASWAIQNLDRLGQRLDDLARAIRIAHQADDDRSSERKAIREALKSAIVLGELKSRFHPEDAPEPQPERKSAQIIELF